MTDKIKISDRFEIEPRTYNYMGGSSETVFIVLDNGKMIGGEFKSFKSAREYAEKVGGNEKI